MAVSSFHLNTRVKICLHFSFLWKKNRCFAPSSRREQQSTGLLHLIIRISSSDKKKAETVNTVSAFLVRVSRFELEAS